MTVFASYPDCAATNLGWIARRPTHWQLLALRHLVTVLDGQRIPLNRSERLDQPGLIPYWGSGGVVGHVDRALFTEELVLLGEDGAPFFDRDRPVAFRIDEPVWVNNHIHVLRVNTNIDPSFLTEYLNQVDYRLYITGSTRDKLTQEDLLEIGILLPPLAEQRQVIKYLDRETGQIDALIAKQQQLVETLTERRQAVIAHAVTRGLDPTVNLKGSGLPWAGAVPAHWLMGQVKHLGDVALGKMIQPEQKSPEDFKAPYMRAANVQPNGVLETHDVKEMWFSAREHVGLTLKSGDVVVVEGGIGGFGRAAYLDEDLDGWGFQNSINRIRMDNADGRYLSYTLISARVKGFITAVCAAVSMPHFTADKLGRFAVPIPPLREQIAISDFLDASNIATDALIAKAHQVVEVLKERRQALISAAVTGKIDVRGL